MFFTNYLLAALAAAPSVLGRPSHAKQPTVDIETVFQLDQNYTWFEALAVRSSGQILATRTDAPEIWAVDPFTKSGSQLVSVPGVNSLLGIAETTPDVFVFAAANFTFQTGFQAGSAQIWELSFPCEDAEPEIRLIASLPDAGLPNAVLKWDDKSVLVADTVKGQIIKLNTDTGAAKSVLEDPTMLPTPNITLQFGVNGLGSVVLDEQTYVYYTNTELALLCRVPVDAKSATAVGPVETILEGAPGDDLLVLDDGTSIIADNSMNVILKVTPDGKNSTIAGSTDSLALASNTSLKFGRTKKDKDVLYVTTAGGYLYPVNESERRPANVASVKFGGKSCKA